MTNSEVDNVTREQWREHLSRFADASVYQTWDYAAVVFANQTSSRIVVREGDEVVAIAQARLATTPVIARGIAYAAWGPLWRRQGASGGGDFEKAMAALAEEYGVRRDLVVRVAPAIGQDEGTEALEALRRLGFKRCHEERTYRTMTLDIARPIEAVRKGFAQKWRNCLNRAERNNLEVAAGTTDELYEEFLSIYGQLRERKGFESGADARDWGPLQRTLAESEKMHVLLARGEGRTLAGAVFSWMGERGIYLFGATSEEGLKSQGSYLLQWRAIEMMKKAGCTVYDLGGIDPEGNPGVYHFKAGLGGREVSHIGMWEFCRSRLSRAVVSAGEALKRAKKKLRRTKG